MLYLSYLLKRVFAAFLTLIGLSIIIFVISRVIPGDPARMALGPMASQQQVEALRDELGLNRSLASQYLDYVKGLMHGKLGESLLTKRDVSADILERLPATLELVIVTILLIIFAGVPLGALAARHPNSWLDNLLRLISIGGVVTPSFFAAILLQLLFGYFLNILPIGGRLSPGAPYNGHPTGFVLLDSLLKGNLPLFGDGLIHIILPAVSLSLADLGQVARITRASMIDIANRDYVMAQRSYGIAQWRLTFKYMLKPSFIPTLTILGLAFASLLGNAFLVELVFRWPGIAGFGVQAILQKDFNAIMAVVLVFGVVFLISSFIVDILAGYVNPRLRLHPRES